MMRQGALVLLVLTAMTLPACGSSMPATTGTATTGPTPRPPVPEPPQPQPDVEAPPEPPASNGDQEGEATEPAPAKSTKQLHEQQAREEGSAAERPPE